MAVFFYQIHLAGCHITEDSQDAVPDKRAEESPPEECAEMHAAQPRRDGDQLADTGDETAYERRDVAFLAEISLRALDLLAGEKA